MNILTYNIRGSGCPIKRKRLGALIRKDSFDLCLLQETKVESFTDIVVYEMWGGTDVEWTFRPSRGRSGGIISMWRKGLFGLGFSFAGDGYVGFNGRWKNLNVYVVNVYSSCTIAKKRVLWKELVKRKPDFPEGAWVFGGDFNAIKCPEERKGRALNLISQEMEEFNDFIDVLEVVDPRAVGKKFTWFSRDGGAMSRLDRFLVSDCLLEAWMIEGQVVRPRDLFDHCPVWIKGRVVDWGPKPFKFYNDWTKHENFLPFVENAWNSIVVRGKAAFVLKEKLKGVREKLRLWNAATYGFLNLEVDEAIKDLNALDFMAANNGGVDVDSLAMKRGIASSRVWDSVKAKEVFLRQKARSTWLAEGDSNSRFFHKAMKRRNVRNSIVGINVAGVWTDKVGE
ncbi:uncharacterized protein LOC131624421 [Vicia villosa]|uniref:uncharacterized protein LOC131624421 n=1 Tax=Vicia villosa TaxID=3911 RepID=UPI00273C5C86|nr:uncharacterized protein LOC131624421 [Vicia villosa]